MSRRLRAALVTAAFSGSWLAAAPAGQAESSTFCVGSADIVQITPGWSLEPTTGTVSTVIDGTQQCTGPIEGHQPTGTMRTHHEMVYGYLQPNTCRDIDAKGWVDYSIPTADGGKTDEDRDNSCPHREREVRFEPLRRVNRDRHP